MNGGIVHMGGPDDDMIGRRHSGSSDHPLKDDARRESMYEARRKRRMSEHVGRTGGIESHMGFQRQKTRSFSVGGDKYAPEALLEQEYRNRHQKRYQPPATPDTVAPTPSPSFVPGSVDELVNRCRRLA